MQTDMQTDGQTCRQTDRHADRRTSKVVLKAFCNKKLIWSLRTHFCGCGCHFCEDLASQLLAVFKQNIAF